MKKKILLVLMVIAIGVFAFGTISVSAETYGNLTYSVSNGEVTITDCDTSASGELVIPATIGVYPVTSIGDSAFSGCSSLVSIEIPDSITSIGYYSAFSGCSSLESITIPDSVTSIGYRAFYMCSSLESITIPDSVTSIGYSAFEDCISFESITIPDSVTSIDNYAFRDCSSLVSITIPDSVTSIGNYAFRDCSSLKKVNISDLEAWCNIDFGTSSSNPLYNGGELYLNDNLVTDITIPESVTSIGDSAFTGCSSLVSIEIPDSVTGIGNNAFCNCISLVSIEIPESVTSIGNMAFYHCSSLVSITIPKSVTSIDNYAFEYCISLESITIPDSVTSIGDAAFRSCSSLESITISDGVTSIGYEWFRYCDSLSIITIPDGVTSIGTRAFHWCTSLESITIPNSVTSIDDGAFYDCVNLKDIYYNGTEEEWNEISISTNNELLTNATIHFIEKYHINSITIKDMSGNSLQIIPTGTFLATVSFTNVSSSEDTVIVLAQYTASGEFKGLMYIQTEDVPTGSTMKLSIPVDNTSGEVAKLKAFCWESFGSLTPMGNSANFPAEQ